MAFLGEEWKPRTFNVKRKTLNVFSSLQEKMIHLSNAFLEIVVDPKGAELKHCRVKATGLDLMWSGDPAFWGKTSPVLFPIVGTLKNQSYLWNDKSYSLPRHGFARDKVFQLEQQTEHQLVLKLSDDEETKQIYPFSFNLRLIYELRGNLLRLTYQVDNPSSEVLYFSLGAHPAFAVPLAPTLQFEDYELIFDENERLDRWPLTDAGLIQMQSIPFLNSGAPIQLNKSQFEQDAWVFKNLKTHQITLQSSKDPRGWHFRWKDFPFFGIWSAKGADFVCLEPWCGIADHEMHEQDFTKKEGIQRLDAHQTWSRSWELEPF